MSLSFDAGDVRPVTSDDFPEIKNVVGWGTVGEVKAVTAGMACHVDDIDRYQPADSEDVENASAVAIAVNSGVEDDPICIQSHGLITFGDDVLTAGTAYVLLRDGTIGEVSELTTGDAITWIGRAVTADYLLLGITAYGLAESSSSSSSSSSA